MESIKYSYIKSLDQSNCTTIPPGRPTNEYKHTKRTKVGERVQLVVKQVGLGDDVS